MILEETRKFLRPLGAKEMTLVISSKAFDELLVEFIDVEVLYRKEKVIKDFKELRCILARIANCDIMFVEDNAPRIRLEEMEQIEEDGTR